MKMATGCSREKPRVKNSKDWGFQVWLCLKRAVGDLASQSEHSLSSQEIRIMLALFVLCVVVMLKQK